MGGSFSLKTALFSLGARMKKDKRVETAVYAGLILLGVAMFFLGSARGDGEAVQPAAAKAEDASRSESEMEQRLEEVLSAIRGAGRVEVMITYDTGSQLVPAMSTDTQTGISESVGADSRTVTENSTQSSKPATISGGGGSETVILTQIEPKVRGVIVIAEGAADVSVRLRLQNAVRTVLGVKGEQIEVFEMKAIGGEERMEE